MNVLITPQTLKGVITAPPSKSFAHRILIAGFLSGKRVKVNNIGFSTDVLVTLNALKQMGASVEEFDGGVYIERKTLPPNKITLDMRDSGSSLRFLIPVVSALGLNAEFTGTERLLNRPISELLEVVKAHGVSVSNLTVSGKMQGGTYEVLGSVSSQYITGLMFALSILGGEIIIKGKRVSAPYLDITESVLKSFGVKVTKTLTGYKIEKGYNLTQTEFTVEGDWSGSAFMLVAGAICGPVTVKGLNLSSVQGDRQIVQIIKKFGAKVKESEGEITVSRGNLKGIEISVENFPDLAQIISVLSAFATGKTVLTGVNRLKDKESNRIDAIVNMLNACSVKCAYDGESITIYENMPFGAQLSGGNDHRTVMSSAILLSASLTEGSIIGAEAHSKSYPEFFNHFKALGGKYGEV